MIKRYIVLIFSEINGVTICYKMGNVQDSEATQSQPQSAPIRPPRPAPPPPITNPSYPNLQDDDHDYEILLPSYPRPSQPAPYPPTTSQNNTNTLNVSNSYSAMEGVPFVINPQFLTSANATKVGNIFNCPQFVFFFTLVSSTKAVNLPNR